MAQEKERTNERGNKIQHLFESNYDRYKFDFGHCKGKDWLQFDTSQDAWYFGVWVNKAERKIVNYCEGDVYITTCPTVESFNEEIKAMCEFYDEGYIFKVIDGANKLLTFRQDRKGFFIDEATQ